jgi:hypothetical protein
MERIDDQLNLERVRGMMSKVYWRRWLLQQIRQKQQAANDAAGIPTIVLEPMQSPEMDSSVDDVDHQDAERPNTRYSPSAGRNDGTLSSPRQSSSSAWADGSPPARRRSSASMLSTPSQSRRYVHAFFNQGVALMIRESLSDDNDTSGDGHSLWADMMQEAAMNETKDNQ